MNERLTLPKMIDMENNAQTPENPQHDAKLPVMPRLFAITSEEGWNEFFWDRDKADDKINTQYKKDFPNEDFWVEEVYVS
jgi:hypothetical protein